MQVLQLCQQVDDQLLELNRQQRDHLLAASDFPILT
jgi:hypothetical protein